jgi:hypothetical protein
MPIKLTVLGFLVVFLTLAVSQPRAGQTTETASNAPTYTADGKLKFPAHYREWIYLTSGVDMSYSPQAMAMGHSMFDNVFVNPEAYRAFLKTGTWPDKTVMVLEARVAGTKASINKKGQFQTGEIMAREVHRKRLRVIPVTNSMPRWIRRSCSFTRRCYRLLPVRRR